jgi:hypothetical protein
MNTKNMKIESKSEQKREDKQVMQLRHGIVEVKRELKQHEKLPMTKAHPQK